jgi:hypothetical protein
VDPSEIFKVFFGGGGGGPESNKWVKIVRFNMGGGDPFGGFGGFHGHNSSRGSKRGGHNPFGWNRFSY